MHELIALCSECSGTNPQVKCISCQETLHVDYCAVQHLLRKCKPETEPDVEDQPA